MTANEVSVFMKTDKRVPKLVLNNNFSFNAFLLYVCGWFYLL